MTGDTPPVHDTRSQRDGSHMAAYLNLSHELRTPANAILGHVELLLSGSAGPLSSEARASIGDIQRAAVALTAQIGHVISLAETLPAPPTGDTGPAPPPPASGIAP